MIDRPCYKERIERALERSPVCALLGPRQCGKTTLAREIGRRHSATFFDLESPRDQLRLSNPESTLGALRGLVVLDEIQTRPDLFPVLRVLADRPGRSAGFLVLGSAAPELVARSAESLAGRVEFVDLHGFDIEEVASISWQEVWLRGGFPKALLAGSDDDSAAWREGFVRTFLERDLPQFGVRVAAPVMRRFWMMLAHWHGQTWNSSELGRAMGLSDKTIRSYLDTLTQTYMVRQLQPWFENLNKRQVKSPKIYLRDSGLLHQLLRLVTFEDLYSYPKIGASWEGFALEQILRLTGVGDAYFWATQSGAELDLLLFRGGKRIGFEFKNSERPGITRSMRVAAEDLQLHRLIIVAPVQDRIVLEPSIEVAGMKHLRELIWEI